jgi:hypothetical protein
VMAWKKRAVDELGNIYCQWQASERAMGEGSSALSSDRRAD